MKQKGKCPPPATHHHPKPHATPSPLLLLIITVIIPEMCEPPGLRINIPGPSLAASCIFRKDFKTF